MARIFAAISSALREDSNEQVHFHGGPLLDCTEHQLDDDPGDAAPPVPLPAVPPLPQGFDVQRN